MHLRLPATGGPWETVREYLGERLPAVAAERVDGLLRAGEVVGEDGRSVGPADPFRPGAHLWFYRELPAEVPVPFELEVLHRDEHRWWSTSRTSWPPPRAGGTSWRRR